MTFRFVGWVGFLPFLLLMLGGCGEGGRAYPVEGRIEYANGQPAGKELEGYLVTFEPIDPPKVSASGRVKDNGTFELGTDKEKDGAVPGKHLVAISPPDSEDPDLPKLKSILLEKYRIPQSSGLEATVEKKRNQITLKVEKAKP